MSKKMLDGNTACALIAYKMSEIAPIYPITPSTSMAELCDIWASKGEKNIFNEKVKVIEMQSEAGAAGALHGALKSGALSTTFTSSQGLLLMIPNMYKIAGEQLPCVIHVAARAIATHALSIFGDHSDVYAVKSTNFIQLCSNSPQEAHDFALISHLSTLKTSLPILHFFDGFRTSHELNDVETISDEEIIKMVDFNAIQKFKDRAMTSTNPTMSGTSQTTDVFFANSEANNTFYNNAPSIIDNVLKDFEKVTNRHYELYEFYGSKTCKNVIVIMGSGANVVKETLQHLTKVIQDDFGVLAIHLFHPFSSRHFLKSLPVSVENICVLEKAKGELLYKEIASVIVEAKLNVNLICGKYGLGGFEFNPMMVKAVIDNMMEIKPMNHFSVGINDDKTFQSLKLDKSFDINDNSFKCIFFGLGGDGTISANKNSAKIIGAHCKNCQAFFVYDSKKSGSTTVSHLRFSDSPIHSSYLIKSADFVAVHHFKHIENLDILSQIKNNGTLLINFPYPFEKIEDYLSQSFIDELKTKNIKLYIINAIQMAHDLNLKNKINIIMQSAFFKLNPILDYNLAKQEMKKAIEISYKKFGEVIIEANKKAVEIDDNLQSVDIYQLNSKMTTKCLTANDFNNDFYKDIMQPLKKMVGEEIPVSKFSPDGYMRTATSQFEKRGIATELPMWKPENCIQCNLCSLVCPHSAIRPKKIDKDDKTIDNIKSISVFDDKTKNFALDISPLDCTGCGNCVNICPAKNKALEMKESNELFDKLNETHIALQDIDNGENVANIIKASQFNQPLLEFSGACAGCGQTTYIKLLTQICGRELVISNATGCSSIWGGSFPSCPYSTDKFGFGPSWSNSLFEDNAEFGFGMKMAYEKLRNKFISDIKNYLTCNSNDEYNFNEWLANLNNFEYCQKFYLSLKNNNVFMHNAKLENINNNLKYIVPQVYFIIGGDGWAYDIGYGGLDHILASGENVNILVLDTEIYSNTGGQASKATPKGAVAKFAESGKKTQKKDLGKLAMCYDNVYVAKICLSANPQQALTAFKEAISYNGPSIILAYAPCVGQGIDMSKTPEIEKEAVSSGYWNLYRRKPKTDDKTEEFIKDSVGDLSKLHDFYKKQARFRKLENND